MIKSFLFLFQMRVIERVSHALWPTSCVCMVLCFLVGTYYGLIISPSDYRQGEMVRFLYLHVPASWLALLTYTVMAISSMIGWCAKIPTAHILTKCLAMPGVIFTGLSIITGSLWGKPIWGTYWAWDARLTSMLILLFIYMGYMSLAYTHSISQKRLHKLSLLVIIGFINIPIIKWSVDFWFTLHQPASIIGFRKSAIDNVFIPPLIWMTLAYIAFGVVLTSLLLLKFIRQMREKCSTVLMPTLSSRPLKRAA